MNSDEQMQKIARVNAILNDKTSGRVRPAERDAVEKELAVLGLELLTDFLVDHKRQAEMLEGIYSDLAARTNRELGR